MSQYFQFEEFTCRCKCGLNNTPPGFIWKLDKARGISGVPYKINSGCRCLKHNRCVGGSPTSTHLRGIAVDIQARSNLRRFHILYGLLQAGFTRIGMGKTFIHADDDPRKAKEVVWLY